MVSTPIPESSSGQALTFPLPAGRDNEGIPEGYSSSRLAAFFCAPALTDFEYAALHPGYLLAGLRYLFDLDRWPDQRPSFSPS